jgi:hypothetical protein
VRLKVFKADRDIGMIRPKVLAGGHLAIPDFSLRAGGDINPVFGERGKLLYFML